MDKVMHSGRRRQHVSEHGGRFRSLRLKLAGAMMLLVFAVAAFLYFFYPARMEASAQRWAERRAVGIGLLLANAVTPGLEFDEAQGVRDLLRGLSAARGAIYGAVYRQNGSILASYHADAVPSTPVAVVGREDYTTFIDGNTLHLVTRIEAASGVRGTLALGFSLEELDAEKQDNKVMALMVSLVIMVLGLGLAFVFGQFLVRPIAGLMRVTSDIIETGDLSQPIEATSHDEVGLLAQSFRGMVEQMGAIMITLRRQMEGMTGAVSQLSKVGTAVSVGANTIQVLVQETSGSVEQMRSSIGNVTQSVDILQRSAEQGSSSILQMATTNDEVASNVQAMAASVQQTAKAVELMASSIQGTARNIEDLNETLSETSASMNEIDSSIGEVEKNATHTARLAELVSANAGGGVEALRRTLDGIERIRGSSRTASEVIERLEKSVSMIGNIVDVIDDVAEQTNLLALNAAIIAAQAGEQGRGFSVVADEIKSLAERTSASTTEIASLIATVQEESRKAVVAMAEGVTSVEEGVQLGHDAAEALEKISTSSNEATIMIQAIARATVQQVRGTKQVTSAMQRIATTVQDISNTSNEQGKSSTQVMESTKTMRTLTAQVQRSSQEQARGSSQVIKAIESITETVSQVSGAQSQQGEATGVVLKAVEEIQRVSEHQIQSMRQLESAISSLQTQADELQSEIQRFHA